MACEEMAHALHEHTQCMILDVWRVYSTVDRKQHWGPRDDTLDEWNVPCIFSDTEPVPSGARYDYRDHTRMDTERLYFRKQAAVEG